MTRVWRCGNRGNVASVLIEKPARGDFLPILDGGFSLQYSPLMEYREGKGLVLFCQMDVTGRTEQDPAAETLARNILRYVAGWKPAARSDRRSTSATRPARRHLEFAGIPVQSYDGGKLSPDQVLIVATGGGRKLAENAAAVADCLKAGGHLLALGLDEHGSQRFLPFKVDMKKAEHIAAYFEPPAADSLLAGVGPADVHNRDPRELPLVSAGATVLGDGVLAQATDANVVFCQLPPYTVTSSQGVVPSFVVDGQDAAGRQAERPGHPGDDGGRRRAVRAERESDTASRQDLHLRRVHQRRGRPGRCAPGGGAGRLALGPGREGRRISVPENQWTDVHVTFKCQKPFPGRLASVRRLRPGRRTLPRRPVPAVRGRLRPVGNSAPAGARKRPGPRRSRFG